MPPPATGPEPPLVGFELPPPGNVVLPEPANDAPLLEFCAPAPGLPLPPDEFVFPGEPFVSPGPEGAMPLVHEIAPASALTQKMAEKLEAVRIRCDMRAVPRVSA
jgi:hypothetical protein